MGMEFENFQQGADHDPHGGSGEARAARRRPDCIHRNETGLPDCPAQSSSRHSVRRVGRVCNTGHDNRRLRPRNRPGHRRPCRRFAERQRQIRRLIGLDTNILLRATLNDDPVQSMAAQRLLRSLGEDAPGFINLLVLMEFFWVLRSRYKLPRTRLAGVMRDLLEIQHIEFEALETVGKALTTYESGNADFSDAIIALRNRELGAHSTFTFDESAAKSVSGMKFLA